MSCCESAFLWRSNKNFHPFGNSAMNNYQKKAAEHFSKKSSSDPIGLSNILDEIKEFDRSYLENNSEEREQIEKAYPGEERGWWAMTNFTNICDRERVPVSVCQYGEINEEVKHIPFGKVF